jgi:hypothetical protein
VSRSSFARVGFLGGEEKIHPSRKKHDENGAPVVIESRQQRGRPRGTLSDQERRTGVSDPHTWINETLALGPVRRSGLPGEAASRCPGSGTRIRCGQISLDE